MIVLAIVSLLSRPVLPVDYFLITPASLVVLAAVVFYIRLDVMLGVLMTVLLWLSLSFGRELAALPTSVWLSWSLGLFVIGWVFQFIGHYFEGRKPAFVDDIMGLAIGPLFVVAEVVFLLGLRQPLKADIEKRLAHQEP